MKLSKLVRALMGVSFLTLRMTENDTSGGGGGTLPASSGAPGGEAGAGSGGGDPGAGGGGNEYDAVPRSWAAEHHSHWSAVTPEVRALIHKREQDVERGIRTYADGHGRWNKLHGVFKDFVSQNPNLDVGSVYEGLAQNHLALLKATPTERREMLKTMAKHYGVDFADMQAASAQQGSSQPGELSPKAMEALQTVLAPLFQKFETLEQREQAQKLEATKKHVDAFFSDPKNKYAKDAGPLMAQLLNSKRSASIEDAYILAIMSTPALKAKYLADLAAEAGGGEGGAPAAPPAGPNLKSSGAPASSGKPPTMDDTMTAVAMKAFPGWKPRTNV